MPSSSVGKGKWRNGNKRYLIQLIFELVFAYQGEQNRLKDVAGVEIREKRKEKLIDHHRESFDNNSCALLFQKGKSLLKFLTRKLRTIFHLKSIFIDP